MPLPWNDPRPRNWKGAWRAEYWACLRREYTGRYVRSGIEFTIPARWGWRPYNRPHHHIHKPETYRMDYLIKLLKAANDDRPGHILRMRHIRTGMIIMADIL